VIRKTILVSFASVFILLAQVENEAPEPRIFPPPEAAYEQLKAHLGLTASQLEQLIQILREKSNADMERYRQISAKHTELRNLLSSGSRDVSRIGQLTLDIHLLSTQPQNPDNSYRERALALLTPEQRTNTTAYQAVSLNLLDPPQPGPPVILRAPPGAAVPVPLPEPMH
jgi:Spy/CpxP family protein refolding chaperone